MIARNVRICEPILVGKVTRGLIGDLHLLLFDVLWKENTKCVRLDAYLSIKCKAEEHTSEE